MRRNSSSILPDGPQAAVHNVSGEEYQVRVFCIDEVHPARQFRPAVVIPRVQVAGQDNGKRLLQRLFRPNVNYFAVFVPVVESAVNQEERQNAENRCRPRHGIFQKTAGHQMKQASQSQHAEQKYGVKEENHP